MIPKIVLAGGFVVLIGCRDSISPRNEPVPGDVIVSSVSIHNDNPDVPTGYLSRVSAKVVFSGRLPSGPVIQWTSSDPTIATIEPEYPLTATVTALSPGTTTISATAGDKTDHIEISVFQDRPRTPEHAFFWTPETGMIDLGLLPTMTSCRPSSINNSDQIVGYCKGNGTGQAFLWFPGAGITEIAGWPGTGNATPTGINDVGQIIGYTTDQHGFIWTAPGGAVDLGSLPEYPGSRPLAISRSGVVVGQAGLQRPFRWTAANGMSALPLTASTGAAVDVNNEGEAVGYMKSPWSDATTSAVAWTPGSELSLVTGPTSQAVGINDSGQIAGTAGFVSAFFWTSAGGMQLIGTLPRTTSSQSAGINNAGQIAGSSNTAFVYRTFIWSQASGMADLGILPGKSGCFASGINDIGHVIGYCF